LHLLDLSQLKSHLGTKWSRLTGHFEQLFEASIRRRMGPGDLFLRIEELAYVVVFRGVSEAEAHFKCRAVAEEVCRHLFGEEAVRATVRNLVADLCGEIPTGPGAGQALDALLEKNGRETIISVQPDGRAAHIVETSARISFADDSGSCRDVMESEIGFLYRPVWDTQKQVVVIYLCQPVAPTHGAEHPVSSGFCKAENHQDQIALDILVLRECAERVRRLRRDGFRLQVALPVAFETIGRSRSWSDYLRTFREIPAELTRDLALMVFGIDSGVPGIRITQELPKLLSVSKAIFCVADDSTGGNGARFSGTGVRALGIALDHSQSELQSIERLKRLGQSARDVGLEAVALGLLSTSLTLNAMGAGVRYLEGPAIRPACPDPRHAFAQPLEYLYAGKLARSS
jgi:hypothetical protein